MSNAAVAETDEVGTSSAKTSYNTIKRDPTTRYGGSFRTRLMLYFAGVAALTALVMTLVLVVVWALQFRDYKSDNMAHMAQIAADAISKEYQRHGRWSEEAIAKASKASSSSDDIGLQLVESHGRVLYDDTWSGPLSDDDEDSASYADENTHIETADVKDADGKVVGQVRIWSFSSDALITKADIDFRRNSYIAIASSAFVALVLAIIIGSASSRKLTGPIRIITTTAAQIRGGDLTARTGLSGDDDIGQLAETFDGMANDIERDIKFEHRLTSDVAHELRTPLMAMQATVEAIQDGVMPADNEHLETVASEVRRLSRLVDAMLHLSRIENGKRQLRIESADVVYMAQSMVSMQKQLFLEQGLDLVFEDKTENHECYADIDTDLIRESITNLMSNAMRYTPEGGSVTVTVDHDKTDAIISVADTGIGIAEEDVSKVFSRFWRSDASRERAAGGLGVGLSITKEIIDQHNGTISVESELGKGTTFSLRLPLSEREPELPVANTEFLD